MQYQTDLKSHRREINGGPIPLLAVLQPFSSDSSNLISRFFYWLFKGSFKDQCKFLDEIFQLIFEGSRDSFLRFLQLLFFVSFLANFGDHLRVFFLKRWLFGNSVATIFAIASQTLLHSSGILFTDAWRDPKRHFHSILFHFIVFWGFFFAILLRILERIRLRGVSRFNQEYFEGFYKGFSEGRGHYLNGCVFQ